MKTLFRTLVLSLAALAATSCVSTKAYRHKDQTVTVHRKGFRTTPVSYWLVGVRPGQVTVSDDLAVYHKRLIKGQAAAPLKCTGFVDTRDDGRIEVQLARKQGGSWDPTLVNGNHKLIDTTAPKPFYHWLIP
jgi:hypothetical protein